MCVKIALKYIKLLKYVYNYLLVQYWWMWMMQPTSIIVSNEGETVQENL